MAKVKKVTTECGIPPDKTFGPITCQACAATSCPAYRPMLQKWEAMTEEEQSKMDHDLKYKR